MPQRHKTPNDNFNLGAWVRNRRRDYKKGTLSPNRIADLETLKGWVWDAQEARLSRGDRKNSKPIKRSTVIRVCHADYKTPGDGYGLGSWVSHRRQELVIRRERCLMREIADLESS